MTCVMSFPKLATLARQFIFLEIGRLQYEPGSADGCKTASSKKSENTQQSWFEKPEHGACS